MKTYQRRNSKLDLTQFEEEDAKFDFLISYFINQLKLAKEVIDSFGLTSQLDNSIILKIESLQSNIMSLQNFILLSSDELECSDVFELTPVQLSLAEKQLIIEYIKNIDIDTMNDMIDSVILDSTKAEHNFELGIEVTSNIFRRDYGKNIISKLKQSGSDEILLDVYEKRFIGLAIQSIESDELKNSILERLSF